MTGHLGLMKRMHGRWFSGAVGYVESNTVARSSPSVNSAACGQLTTLS